MSFLILYTFLNEVIIHFQSTSLVLNMVLYNVYAMVAVLLCLIIILLEVEKAKFKSWLKFSILAALALCTFSVARYGITKTFPFATIAFVFPIIIFCSFFLYWQLLNSDLEESILKKSSFWLATALLVYHTLTFATMGVYTFYLNFKIAHFSGNLMFYICLVYYSLLGYSIYLDGSRTGTRSA